VPDTAMALQLTSQQRTDFIDNAAWRLVTLALVLLCLMVGGPAWADESALREQAKVLFEEEKYDEAVAILETVVAANPTAANCRPLAEAYEAAGRYPEASGAYLQAAAIYKDIGDAGAYRIWQRKGSSLACEAKLYVEEPGGKLPPGSYTGAKFEPFYGCYIGAFNEDDDKLYTGRLLDGRRSADKAKFAELTGKAHASYFNYFLYGRPFPKEWAAHLKEFGAAPHIAWEGKNHKLGEIKDDEYLQEFAQEARRANCPVFVRFGYEMNGDWNDYGTPEEFIDKFRIVHDVMEREAPNVAMVWSPNSFPEQNMADYYPGDEYVDWVGVSMYTVYCHNGDPQKPAFEEDPTDNLLHVYSLYSQRKPIMISEHAVTHYCAATDKDVTDFAISKLRYLYASLPRRFPRVKMVSWYSRNNIGKPSNPARKLNNYCLTDNEQVLAAYKDAIGVPYYLSKVPFKLWERPQTPPLISELPHESTVKGTIRVSAWVKAPVLRPTVSWLVDGEVVKKTDVCPYELTLDTTTLPNKRIPLKIVAYGEKENALARTYVVINVNN